MEFTVNGKKVVVKDTLTMLDGYDLYGLMADQTSRDMRTQVPLLVKMIESWELAGNPADPDAYNGLDVFHEFLPLARKIIRYINEMLVAGVKDETEQESLKN